MARRKNWGAEQIAAKLRQSEVQITQGKSLALACKEVGISEENYYLYGRLSRCKSSLNCSAGHVANIYPASPDLHRTSAFGGISGPSIARR
jgi:putative transposase